MIWSILTAVFAFAAAVFWFCSAVIYVPKLGSGYGSLTSLKKDGSAEKDGGALFFSATGKVSRLNKWAGICAGIAALAQAVTLFPHR